MFARLVLGMLMWLPEAACVFYISISAVHRRRADKLLHSCSVGPEAGSFRYNSTFIERSQLTRLHEARHMTINPTSYGSTFLQELKSLRLILQLEVRTLPTFPFFTFPHPPLEKTASVS